MSNESSASETTPLRRPNSRNRADGDADVITSHVNVPTNTRNHPSINSPVNTELVNSATHSIAIANHNNNRIEVRLSESNSNNYRSSSIRMETNKRILCRVGLDVLILLCVGFPILLFFLLGDSYKRGFFCDDESLKHPFKVSTVKNWMLYIIGLVIPVVVIFSVEIFKSKNNSSSGSSQRRYVFMDYDIPDWLVECYKKIGMFGFGAAVGQLTTDIAKYSIGRLRPHFFAVCQPIRADGTTCDDPANAGIYIQDFRCRGVGSTERMIKEVSLSFPSGHSSFTFYTMVYVALYLQSRMTWRGSKLLRHFLQFLLIMIAWYTALSRVSDYKHHWSDVLAGSLIGTTVALIVANYCSDLFQEKATKSYVLPRTSQDMPPQTITTNGH